MIVAPASIYLADHERKSSQQTMLLRYELRPVDSDSPPRTTLEAITGTSAARQSFNPRLFGEATSSSIESNLLRKPDYLPDDCGNRTSILIYALKHDEIRLKFVLHLIDQLQDNGSLPGMIDFQDYDGCTPLISLTLNLKSLASDWDRKFHGAAYKKDRIDQTLQAINKLLTLGASPNISDHTNETPLGHLIDFDYKNGRQLLIPAIQLFIEQSSNKTINNAFSQIFSTKVLYGTFRIGHHDLGLNRFHELLETGNVCFLLGRTKQENKFISVLTAIRNYRVSWNGKTDWVATDKELTQLIEASKKNHLSLSSPQIACTKDSHPKRHIQYDHREWFGKYLQADSPEENFLICQYVYFKLISEPILKYYREQLNKHVNDPGQEELGRQPPEIIDIIAKFIAVNPYK